MSHVRWPGLQQVLEWFAQLAMALGYIHDQASLSSLVLSSAAVKPARLYIRSTCLPMRHVMLQRVLHRDLKTQNIFLSHNRVALGDFGIARELVRPLNVTLSSQHSLERIWAGCTLSNQYST